MSQLNTDDIKKLELVTCQKCGHTLGWYKSVGGKTWIQTGNVVLESGHGQCAACGEEWHFNSSDKQLEDLLKHCTRKTD